ncbi:putative ubiquitin carboxyl-terminal hydrolase 50 [Oryzias melastigma]|uniref:Ubiquitin carboxyl-terminal hydrolase n=1 Tax=Oryzias melastigma TaxID=30732 RepID=A0A834FFA4_ORYME|nr:putative ubiquitin carboxyl-terminal hydrolase 50 [Oryzias melastigma]
MKASSLTVKECTWTTEECHLVEELGAAVETDTFCLPNIFRSRKVKPRRKTPVTPTYQVYYTARELFLEVLDREAIWELIRRAPGVKAGDQRLSHSREQSSVLSEEYAEALMWFSIVLQSGLCVGENCKVLHSPGPNLTVTKYRLYHQQGQCSLQLALLSDTSSGFVCNMFLYCQQQLQKQSRKPVVEQVVRHLLGPFSSQKRVVQIDSSAWTEGRLQSFLSGVDMNVHFVPVTQNEVRNPTSSLPISPQRLSSEDTFSAHLQGWTGPSLVPHSDLTGSSVDIFLPGLWVALHTVCINTYVLHSLQRLQLSGKQIHLTEFSRALASQLTADHCISVPVLPLLNSCSYQEERKVCCICRVSSNGVATAMENSSLLLRFQKRWRRPGVCGLENSGNSCYLNVVLQCLCATVPLVEQLLHWDTRKELAKSKCRVSEVFVHLLEIMWLGGGSSCSPLEVRSALCSVLPQFNNDSQQDAQELLLLLLNTLHDDFNKVLLHMFELSAVCAHSLTVCFWFGSKGKNQVKLRTNVLFFTELDLSQFLSGLVPNESSYHLYAVVNHSGHLTMGHYTAVCYNSPAQTWHYFDDAAVSEVQEDRLQSPNAYLLFYSHKPFHRPRISGL